MHGLIQLPLRARPHCSRQILCSLFTALLLAACSHSSDERQVLAVIAAAEAAAEARSTSAAMALVANDYMDAQGFHRQQLQQFLRAYFLTHPKIELVVRIGKVRFETTDRARVAVEVTLVGTRVNTDTAQTSLSGDAITLMVELHRRDAKWQVVRADLVTP